MSPARFMLISSVVASIFLFTSCNSNKGINVNKYQELMGTVAFSCSVHESLAKILVVDSSQVNRVDAAYITIQNSNGSAIYTSERVKLYRSGNQFFSSLLPLGVGSYSITQFLLVSQNNDILFATPLNRTSLSNSVSSPLPMQFSVSVNDSASLPIQVITFRPNKAAEFGLKPMTVTIRDSSNQNNNPTVLITSPSNNSSVILGQNITINATASDSDGLIRMVRFYKDSVIIAADSISPYSVTVNSGSLGNHRLYCIAFDNLSASTQSPIVNYTVVNNANKLPHVNITSPSNSSNFLYGSNITIQATATDSDGTINNVKFYKDSVLVLTDSTFPYSAVVNCGTAGRHQVYCVAFDSQNASAQSQQVNYIVNANVNKPPVVSIRSILNGATYTLGSKVRIEASASDSDGTIRYVKFYMDSTLIGVDSIYPYELTTIAQSTGLKNISVVAYDNANSPSQTHRISLNFINIISNDSLNIEAETNAKTLNGQAVVENASGASGGKVVGYIGNNSNNWFRLDSINVRGGTYQTTIWYVSGESRNLSIQVNDSTIQTFTSLNSGSWQAPAQISTTIVLNPGMNKIKFFNNTAWGVSVDKIRLVRR